MVHPLSRERIDTVLIANRGEIAVRIIRTLRRLGIRSVAVYSDADAGARHVREADEAVRLGPSAAAESYLSIERVLAAARRTGAQAIHPGFGFLAENAAFARACADAGIVFIGPDARAIEVMGDKIAARAAVEARGVATVPGLARPGLSDGELSAGAAAVGFPVLIKPSAGGGGKGMHVVTHAAELTEALAAARREAAASFGDDALFLERYVATPRHIEVQIIADAHGHVVHLGERECSLQRRHQKVIEEAPSPLLSDLAEGAAIRERLGAAACETARSVGYVGAGTVEFIVSADRPEEFFFMEMNTRLQVEHPVTEEITGLDLVALQLLVAAGDPLPFTQDDVTLTGHSIEARVYAEDPRSGFLPTGGRVLRVVHPATEDRGCIRVDSALEDGLEVGVDYDPMLAKVISWGPDRATALRRLSAALADTVVLGFETNIEFLRLLLAHPDVAAGALDTGLIARVFDELRFTDASDRLFTEAALVQDAAASAPGLGDPWRRCDGWRLGPPAPRRYTLESGDRRGEVRVGGAGDTLRVAVDEGAPAPAAVTTLGDGRAVVRIGDVSREVVSAQDGAALWLAAGGVTVCVRERITRAERQADAAASPQAVSPLPGTVVLIPASDGAHVEPGDALVVVEAMKMEHVLRAAVAGTVRIDVAVGDRVARGAVVARVEPD
ncbi:MAG: ATP-grasp domain-containing protein [Microbacterium hominis]|jgi:acetyl-CoA/propionyl-CoA carboxylase biotin carboxyl carrier protein|uniref:ATP-binding protein n=1 Tax=Microbacterium aurum TaxID=36805 RepID=UPI00248ED9AF|nr:biotin carboxylase N-terminal domain-containing protein [Microbacterium aurum]MBZ6372561.1 ATP-grasp domain-containing protein [Microbacterium hominis]